METEVIYNITEVRELARRYPELVRQESRRVMDLIVRRLEKDVVEGTPKGVGGQAGLAGSTQGEVVMFGQSVRGMVGQPLEYGEVVELGRRPGKAMPPVEPIALWARSKLGVPADEAKSVGFAIARKIAEKGFEGAHMFEKAWNRNEAWIQSQLGTIPMRVQRRLSA